MKKVVMILLMIFSLALQNLALADGVSNFKLLSNDDIELKVKPLPDEYKKSLGDNYILIDYAYFQEVYEGYRERDIYKRNLEAANADLGVHKLHITRLEEVVQIHKNKIGEMDEYISYQQGVIENLQPTVWDKYKFGIGILIGAGGSIGTAIMLDQLNDN